MLYLSFVQLLEGYEVSEEGNYEVPLPQPATYQDWLQEFRDASQGARPGLELTGAWTFLCIGWLLLLLLLLLLQEFRNASQSARPGPELTGKQM
jgi:hypothetical protein